MKISARNIVKAFDGATGSYDWHYGGAYDATGKWTKAQATANGGTETYGFGTDGRANGLFGTVTGSFTGVPTNCPAPAPSGCADLRNL